MTTCVALFFREKEEMNGVDVSSWLLIEDSADSEADSGFFSLYPSRAAIAGDDEDDAESCNCDTDGVYGLSKVGDGHEDDQEVDEISGFEDDSNESDSGSSTMWLSDATLECLSPLPVEDEQQEMKMGEVNVHELEDRLFWETCMAVGYP